MPALAERLFMAETPEALSLTEILTPLMNIFTGENTDQQKAEGLIGIVDTYGVDRFVATARAYPAINSFILDSVVKSQTVTDEIKYPGKDANQDLAKKISEALANTQIEMSGLSVPLSTLGLDLEVTPETAGTLRRVGGIVLDEVGRDEIAQEFFNQTPPQELAAYIVQNASVDEASVMLRRAISYNHLDHFNAILDAVEKGVDGKKPAYSVKDVLSSNVYNGGMGGYVSFVSGASVEQKAGASLNYPPEVLKRLHKEGIDISEIAITALQMNRPDVAQKVVDLRGKELDDLKDGLTSRWSGVITTKSTPETIDWILEPSRGVDIDFVAQRVAGNEALAAHVAAIKQQRAEAAAAAAPPPLEAATVPPPPPASPAGVAFDGSAELTLLIAANGDRAIPDFSAALAAKDRSKLTMPERPAYTDAQLDSLFKTYQARAKEIGITVDTDGAHVMLSGNSALLIGNDQPPLKISQAQDVLSHEFENGKNDALIARYNVDTSLDALKKQNITLQDGADHIPADAPEVVKTQLQKLFAAANKGIDQKLEAKQITPEAAEFLRKDPAALKMMTALDLENLPRALTDASYDVNQRLEGAMKAAGIALVPVAEAPPPAPAAPEPPAAPVVTAEEDAGSRPVKDKDQLLKIAKEYQQKLSQIAEEEGLGAAAPEKDKEALARWAFVFAAAHENGIKTSKEANHLVEGTTLNLPEESDIRAAAQAMASMLKDGKKITYTKIDEVLPPVTPQQTSEAGRAQE